EPSFRAASSDLVVLPVTVVDKRGRFISDIPADRFAVFDNGRRRDIALFSNEDTPVTIGLVLDDSGSMHSKVGEVVAAATAFARSSKPHDELFVIDFNDDVHAAPPGQFIDASRGSDLLAALARLRPEGQTALYDALMAALDRLEYGSRPRKVLVVISDG